MQNGLQAGFDQGGGQSRIIGRSQCRIFVSGFEEHERLARDGGVRLNAQALAQMAKATLPT